MQLAGPPRGTRRRAPCNLGRPSAGLWLQVEASRRQNDPRKATWLLSMVRLRSKPCPTGGPTVGPGWQASVGAKTRSAAGAWLGR